MRTPLLTFFVMLLLSQSVLGLTLKLDDFDQLKLANLIGNLPTSVRLKKVSSTSTPVKGLIVRSTFPARPRPLKIDCRSTYFGGSLYPSFAKCLVSIDVNSPAVEHPYDVYQIVITDPKVAHAFHQAIPYGTPEKLFHSHGTDLGTTPEGVYSNVFHYLIACSRASCAFKFFDQAATAR